MAEYTIIEDTLWIVKSYSFMKLIGLHRLRFQGKAWKMLFQVGDNKPKKMWVFAPSNSNKLKAGMKPLYAKGSSL